ncbi:MULTISPECIES: YqzM family protein [Savagea]|uniref:YqzM family protein n=2 Tax=Savagea TaxID=1655429 RepID=A0A8J7GB06_9BACL|nr:YqzM family protein [Savagea serpentis]MBF4500151.1 YqzM family protein [Savagea serpentis]
MNEFEKDVQCKRNDFNDSAVGFVVAFLGFSSIFVIATIIDLVGSL